MKVIFIFQHYNWVIGGCALLISVCCIAPVKADFPKPIAPPKSERLTPIGPTSSPGAPSALPNNTSRPTSKTTVVDAAHRHLPILIDQMLNNQLTPQKAWDEKLLSVDDLLWIFTSYIDPWGSFNWKFNVEVRRDLAALLARNLDQKIEPIEKLPPIVRLWLADYYMSIGDERTVTVGESILKELKVPVADEDALAFQTIERIGRFYNDRGKHQKAIEAWQGINNYYASTSRFIADSRIEMARIYRSTGNDDKAEQLFLQVIENSPGQYSVSAIIEVIGTKILQGKQQDIFVFIDRLTRQATVPGDIGLSHVLASSQLGQLYYLKGDRLRAKMYYDQTLKQAQQLPTTKLREDVERVLARAKEALQLLKEEETQRIICDPTEIIIMADAKEADQPVTRKFLVSTSRNGLLSVTSEIPAIKVLRIEDSPWLEDQKPLKFEKQVVIEIEPKMLQKEVTTNLAVSLQENPEVRIIVPLRVVSRKEVEENKQKTGA